MIERSGADRIGGLLAVGFGVLAVREAIRLFPLRTSEYAGDHITFGLLGGVLLILGLLLATVVRTPRFNVELPRGTVKNSMLVTAALLFVYLYLVPAIGYVWSTFPIAAGLFRALGSYKWRQALLFAAILTAALYVVFELWLHMSLPGGMF